jgi:hypothetical protein
MQRPTAVTVWRALKFDHAGHTIVGSYAYNKTDQTIQVRNLKGSSKTTDLGGMTPEALAKLMLIEMADEGKA